MAAALVSSSSASGCASPAGTGACLAFSGVLAAGVLIAGRGVGVVTAEVDGGGAENGIFGGLLVPSGLIVVGVPILGVTVGGVTAAGGCTGVVALGVTCATVLAGGMLPFLLNAA